MASPRPVEADSPAHPPSSEIANCHKILKAQIPRSNNTRLHICQQDKSGLQTCITTIDPLFYCNISKPTHLTLSWDCLHSSLQHYATLRNLTFEAKVFLSPRADETTPIAECVALNMAFQDIYKQGCLDVIITTVPPSLPRAVLSVAPTLPMDDQMIVAIPLSANPGPQKTSLPLSLDSSIRQGQDTVQCDVWSHKRPPSPNSSSSTPRKRRRTDRSYDQAQLDKILNGKLGDLYQRCVNTFLQKQREIYPEQYAEDKLDKWTHSVTIAGVPLYLGALLALAPSRKRGVASWLDDSLIDIFLEAEPPVEGVKYVQNAMIQCLPYPIMLTDFSEISKVMAPFGTECVLFAWNPCQSHWIAGEVRPSHFSDVLLYDSLNASAPGGFDHADHEFFLRQLQGFCINLVALDEQPAEPAKPSFAMRHCLAQGTKNSIDCGFFTIFHLLARKHNVSACEHQLGCAASEVGTRIREQCTERLIDLLEGSPNHDATVTRSLAERLGITTGTGGPSTIVTGISSRSLEPDASSYPVPLLYTLDQCSRLSTVPSLRRDPSQTTIVRLQGHSRTQLLSQMINTRVALMMVESYMGVTTSTAT